MEQPPQERTEELLEKATDDLEFYRKGLQDFMNKQNTDEALGYIAYWSVRTNEQDPYCQPDVDTFKT